MRFVHDPRQRHSYELRPDQRLDASLRSLAARLDSDGLLVPGASTAPRFQPHLTFCRARCLEPRAVEVAAGVIEQAGPTLTLATADTFGGGRIIWLAPDDIAPLVAARMSLLAQLDPSDIDPLATSRPWTPHVTIAYAVPEHARAEALAVVERALPLSGTWQCVQAWDLDVRPTQLLIEHRCVGRIAGG